MSEEWLIAALKAQSIVGFVFCILILWSLAVGGLPVKPCRYKAREGAARVALMCQPLINCTADGSWKSTPTLPTRSYVLRATWRLLTSADIRIVKPARYSQRVHPTQAASLSLSAAILYAWNDFSPGRHILWAVGFERHESEGCSGVRCMVFAYKVGFLHTK